MPLSAQDGSLSEMAKPTGNEGFVSFKDLLTPRLGYQTAAQFIGQPLVIYL